jgi:hypothetical protein
MVRKNVKVNLRIEPFTRVGTLEKFGLIGEVHYGIGHNSFGRGGKGTGCGRRALKLFCFSGFS